jgi:uroporphyrin-III C-methyltransferase/precorrin-2 dehydrogenase/sirohydrochlorin ferrochelatase
MNAPLRHPVPDEMQRIAPLARMPLFFALGGKRVVVAGDGPAVAWKAELLAAAGARVDVIGRSWTSDELRGAALAIGGFDDDETATEFAAAARELGIPVNVIDRPAFCDFSFGSIVNRSPLVIGISTDGAAPVFAQAIRARIEALLPQGFSRWVEVAARWRGAVKGSGLSFAARRSFWRAFTVRALANPHAEPSEGHFGELMDEVKRGAAQSGSLAVIGCASANPDLLTLGDVRTLQSADVVVFDPSISLAVLDFARREATRIPAGAADPDALAASGQRVVRLLGVSYSSGSASQTRRAPPRSAFRAPAREPAAAR